VVFDSILNRAPAPASQANPGLPPKLDEIIGKALEKDRELRCQTAAELRADLKRLKRDMDTSKTIAARSPSSTETPAVAPTAAAVPARPAASIRQASRIMVCSVSSVMPE